MALPSPGHQPATPLGSWSHVWACVNPTSNAGSVRLAKTAKPTRIPLLIVLIAALAGGTLAGLPGALVAIPVAAGILLIIKEVVVPAKARS